MLNNLVCSLIKHRRVTTTLAKAKAARVVADKMVTLGKKGQADGAGLQYRRLIAARLQQNPRSFFPKKNGVLGREQRAYWRENEDVVRILFEDIAPVFETAMEDTPASSSLAAVRVMPPRWRSWNG